MRDPVAQRRYERALAYWTKQAQPLIDKARESERLTAADLAIRVGPCP
jgi:hypothetical protein